MDRSQIHLVFFVFFILELLKSDCTDNVKFEFSLMRVIFGGIFFLRGVDTLIEYSFDRPSGKENRTI